MQPPNDLSPEALNLWHEKHAQLVKQGTLVESDADLLAMYVRQSELVNASLAHAAAEPFVAGSKGQLVAHPGAKVAKAAMADVLALAKALLLTPERRKVHGIESVDGEDELDALLS